MQKETLIEEVEKVLGRKVNYGLKSLFKGSKEIIVDTIEVDYKSTSAINHKDLLNISNNYEVVGNKVVIEILQMTNFFKELFTGESVENYDIMESNMFGAMRECLAFQIK